MKKIEKFFSGAWFGVLLVILIMCISLCVRIPSFTLSGYKDKNIEAYRDEEKTPYLHDMDSYYYSTFVKMGAETNNVFSILTATNPYNMPVKEADKVITNSNNFMLLPFVSVLIYKLTGNIFNLSVNRFIALIGPILYVLAVIPAYIFVKRRTNRVGAITAGVIAGMNASFFVSTGFSAYDTDILLCVVPLLFLTLFAESFLAKTLKKGIIYAGLSGFAFLLLTLTWNAYFVYFYLVEGLCFLFLFIYLIKCKFKFRDFIKINEVKILLINILINILISFIVFGKIDLSIFSLIFSLFKGTGTVYQESGYPDPGRFVSELGSLPLFSGDIKSICNITKLGFINRCGGIFSFLLFIAAYIKMFVELFDKKLDLKNKLLLIMLLIWVTGGIVSISMGSRFMKIFIIPALLMIGLSIGQLYKIIKQMKIGYFFILTAFIVIWLPYFETMRLAEAQSPSANDALHETTNYLRENTDENAVIASWWDYGYYYGYDGQRSVLSHGGTFSGRFYYFLSKALVTENIELTKGIFRMIASSGLEASYLIDEYMESPKKGCDVLKRILALDKEEAEKVLKEDYYFTDKQVDKLLSLTHTIPDKDVILIISEDMISKIGAINYYGNYNFVPEYEYSTELNKNCMMSKLYYEDEYEGLEHLTRIEDVTHSRSTNIWKIIY